MEEVSSPFNSNSPISREIASFFTLSFVIAGIIFLIVAGGVLYSVWRFRARPGDREPKQIFGNTRLEIAWTAAPALILIVIFILMLPLMGRLYPVRGQEDQQQPDIIVTGYQWWWHIEYPGSQVITANEIHVPVGQRLLIQLEAVDVIHAFSVPQLTFKRDMIPGHTNYVWLEAEKPGIYLGACFEYCGAQHAWMRLRVIAHPQDEFTAWQQQHQQTPAIPTSGAAARGAELFNDLTCVNCHAVRGRSEALAGPDLTHIASRETLGAGVITNTRENLADWITNPHTIKPGTYMPGFQLPDEDLQALLDYMETLE